MQWYGVIGGNVIYTVTWHHWRKLNNYTVVWRHWRKRNYTVVWRHWRKLNYTVVWRHWRKLNYTVVWRHWRKRRLYCGIEPYIWELYISGMVGMVFCVVLNYIGVFIIRIWGKMRHQVVGLYDVFSMSVIVAYIVMQYQRMVCLMLYSEGDHVLRYIRVVFVKF
jgi:hypothetical protein